MGSVRTAFTEALRQRILVLDGAMGTMIQALKLDEQDFRGARFDAWNREVRGNNDLLNLSRPQAVREIHLAIIVPVRTSFPPTPSPPPASRRPTTRCRASRMN